MKWLSRFKMGPSTDTTDRLHKEKTIQEPQEGVDKFKMEPLARTISEIPSKKNRKKVIKELQKKLDVLIEEHIHMELRPCRGDADLHQRGKDLEMLEAEIRTVEKDLDKHIYTL